MKSFVITPIFIEFSSHGPWIEFLLFKIEYGYFAGSLFGFDFGKYFISLDLFFFEFIFKDYP